jgi:hemerythrin-like domain-containing protein
MQARSPLMIEHRLIEKMIALIRQTLSQTDKEKKIDPAFVDIAIDFFHTYADRTHHGKEEDILFRDLNKKDLREEDRRLMNELIEEHISGRRIAQRIFEANSRYRNGDEPALKEIASHLSSLTEFYRKHIEKEDKEFFPAARRYFSEQEDQAMLSEFWEFDRKMIHEKYVAVVEALEGQ